MMLSYLQLSYSRVETSLQTLIDSIAAYNPSVSAAESLLAADAQVSQDLDLLVTHQRNALRLAELRNTSAQLDETIKSTIRLLAETRRGVQGIAPFVGSAEQGGSSGSRGADSQGEDNGGRMKTLPVKDVLDYAKFISKTSIPPTYRAPPPSSSFPETTNNASTAAAPPTPAAAATTTNGLTTPTTALSSPPAQPLTTTANTTNNNTALSALPSTTASFLNPTAESLPFQPWPSQEVIASGALANLQRMVEAGQDPAEVKSAEEIAAEEERLREEEEREREEQRRREDMFGHGPGGGGGGGRAGGGPGGGGEVAFNPDDL